MVKYCGVFNDASGYAQANRTFITALYLAEVPIQTELVTQTFDRGDYGWQGQLCNSLRDKTTDYKIKIIHLTPDCYYKYMEEDKYMIGHLFWETDRLPDGWTEACNKMDEIWTATEKQAEMIKNSGVTVPIKWFPQPIDTGYDDFFFQPYSGFSGYKFYSIFQWIERKNPRALIETYWQAFTGKEDVELIIKTYGVDYSESEYERIKNQVARWKKELALPHYPRIALVKQLLDTNGIFKLHSTGDCFVSTNRGEGWGIPVAEAMMMGKPVISVDQTGIFDILSPSQYYPCKTTLEDVTYEHSTKYYQPPQKWLEIDKKDLKKNMLYVYNHQLESKKLGEASKNFIKTNFNYWAIGKAMKSRINQILKTL